MTAVIPAKAQDYTKHRQRMSLAKAGNEDRYASHSRVYAQRSG
ncbi:hypothetical protein [Aeromonas sp. FDAARGOS 1403]|nr:hypothetical protein [Aeromonas sp. FDAARGOS 1403]